MLSFCAGVYAFCFLMLSRPYNRRVPRIILAGPWVVLMMVSAHAGISLRGGTMSGSSGNHSSASSTSQTATAATDNTSQSVTASAGAQQAQASLSHSIQALQAMQAAQQAARTLAIVGANNLGTNPLNTSQSLPNVTDGIGTGGCSPTTTELPRRQTPSPSRPVATGRAPCRSLPTTPSHCPQTFLPRPISRLQAAGWWGRSRRVRSSLPLMGGTATTVPAGSTISITATSGSTVTFAGGSAGVPANVTTYNFGSALSPSSIPVTWSSSAVAAFRGFLRPRVRDKAPGKRRSR